MHFKLKKDLSFTWMKLMLQCIEI